MNPRCLWVLTALLLGCSGGERGGGAPNPTAAPAGNGSLPAAASAAEPRFFDVTEASDVRWTHNTGAFGERWLPETMGSGLVIFDANGDERLDLLFLTGRNFPDRPGAATRPGFFLNQGGLRFREASREAGLDRSHYCLGGAAADYDNDGDADLLLICLGQDLLLRNDGGRFTDVSRRAGLAEEYEFGAGGVFFDADRDGFLDIYVTRYVEWTPETDRFCALFGEGKSYCTPTTYPGASGRFYRNQGDGTFAERTHEAGLWDPEAKALGVMPLDLEGDGWVDLVVACDTTRNRVFHNLGDGTFEDIAMHSGIAFSVNGRARGGMGIAAGDYERSGLPGLVITYFADDMVGLYQNMGERFFLDVASNHEVGRKTLPYLSWGTFFFDYDLDGWLDLLIANGHLDPKVDSLSGFAPWAQPQQLFHNLGGGRFVEVTNTTGGDLARPLPARGAAFADLDDDGDLDLVFSTNGGPAKVFENRGRRRGNWLRISLRGTKSNRDGLGAVVAATAGAATQSWQLRSGGSYLSQSQVDPTFGLGDVEKVDELVVRWPSGTIQRLRDLPVNQRLVIVEHE